MPDALPISLGAQCPGEPLVATAYHDLALVSANFQYIQRRTRGHPEPLALAHGKVVNATVGPDNLAGRGDLFACGIGKLFALLREVGVEELLIVAARNETNLLRVGLFEQPKSGAPGLLAHLGLAQLTKRKHGAAQLLLRQAEEEIGLVLGAIGWALQHPASAAFVELVARVMSSRQQVRPDLARGD